MYNDIIKTYLTVIEIRGTVAGSSWVLFPTRSLDYF
jgi:hypothetical protein